jgi:hypothetical protein
MKSQAFSTTDRTSGSFTRMHLFLTIIGIIAAVAGSLVLLKDMRQIDQAVRKTGSVSSIIHQVATHKAITSISILVSSE